MPAKTGSIHPLKSIESRLRDMLAMNPPLWRIAEVLEITEETIRKRYRHILDEFGIEVGNKPYVPSDADRQRVRLMAVAGIVQEDIARVIGIPERTMRRHFREELDLALIEANAKVAGNLFMMATGPRNEKATAQAAIWWTKARMGWRDTTRVEQTGADGGPLQIENQVVVVLPDNGRGDKVIDGFAQATEALPAPSPEIESESDDEDC